MILCCGEALIDMLPAETTAGGAAFAPHAGGAVYNTSIALGRLGISAGLLTGLSTDMFGDALRTGLAESNVDASLAITSDRPTTLAFVKLTDGHASYSFMDENSAGRMIAPSDLPDVPADVPALYFGGISLACEPGADAYAALLDKEGAGRVVMIDPNIRPSFITDEARYRARLEGMIAAADIVKTSDEDLEWLITGESSVAEKAAKLAKDNTAIVILTRGAEGATAYLPDGGEVSVPAVRATVVDTVGAGDTFNAGVLASLSQQGVLTKDAIGALTQDQIAEALAYGARVSSITVSRAGANPPWSHEL